MVSTSPLHTQGNIICISICPPPQAYCTAHKITQPKKGICGYFFVACCLVYLWKTCWNLFVLCTAYLILWSFFSIFIIHIIIQANKKTVNWLTAKTQYRKFETNIPRKGNERLQARFLYWEYINLNFFAVLSSKSVSIFIIINFAKTNMYECHVNSLKATCKMTIGCVVQYRLRIYWFF